MEKYGELYFTVRALKMTGTIINVKNADRSWVVFVVVIVAIAQFFLYQVLTGVKYLVSPKTLARSVVTVLVLNNGFQSLFKYAFFAWKLRDVTRLLQQLDSKTQNCNNWLLICSV